MKDFSEYSPEIQAATNFVNSLVEIGVPMEEAADRVALTRRSDGEFTLAALDVNQYRKRAKFLERMSA